jgi:hypothetical protein
MATVDRGSSRRLRSWLLHAVLVGPFYLWIASTLWLGGNASLGKIEGNRYFLGSHGAFVETDYSTFNLSLWLGRIAVSLFVPSLLIGLLVLYRRNRL